MNRSTFEIGLQYDVLLSTCLVGTGIPSSRTSNGEPALRVALVVGVLQTRAPPADAEGRDSDPGRRKREAAHREVAVAIGAVSVPWFRRFEGRRRGIREIKVGEAIIAVRVLSTSSGKRT